MEHPSSFLTGFLTGRRLKARLAGVGPGGSGGSGGTDGGTSFYDWAAQSGGGSTLSDPGAYRQAVYALPLSVVINDSFVWQAKSSDIRVGAYYQPDVITMVDPGEWEDDGSHCVAHISTGLSSANIQAHGLNNCSAAIAIRATVAAPWWGVYTRLRSAFFRGEGGNEGTDEVFKISLDYDEGFPQTFHAGQTFTAGASSSIHPRILSGVLELPVYSVQPLNDPFEIITRPGSLQGSPVNEDAKTFTNPFTGEIIPFNSYSYDYTSRTYTLTLPDDGGTITVTFADDCISFSLPDGSAFNALYPDSSGAPVTAPSGSFHRNAFLSGLAAGMAGGEAL